MCSIRSIELWKESEISRNAGGSMCKRHFVLFLYCQKPSGITIGVCSGGGVGWGSHLVSPLAYVVGVGWSWGCSDRRVESREKKVSKRRLVGRAGWLGGLVISPTGIGTKYIVCTTGPVHTQSNIIYI